MKTMAAVTLSSDNGPSRIWPSLNSCPAPNVAQRPVHAPRSPFLLSTTPGLFALGERRP